MPDEMNKSFYKRQASVIVQNCALTGEKGSDELEKNWNLVQLWQLLGNSESRILMVSNIGKPLLNLFVENRFHRLVLNSEPFKVRCRGRLFIKSFLVLILWFRQKMLKEYTLWVEKHCFKRHYVCFRSVAECCSHPVKHREW